MKLVGDIIFWCAAFIRIEVEGGWCCWSVLSKKDKFLLLAKTVFALTFLGLYWLWINYEHWRWKRWLISTGRAKAEYFK